MRDSLKIEYSGVWGIILNGLFNILGSMVYFCMRIDRLLFKVPEANGENKSGAHGKYNKYNKNNFKHITENHYESRCI